MILFVAGEDIHAKMKDGGMTAPRLAAACNPDAEVTELLLRRGAFSKNQDSRALTYAADLNPNPEVCTTLLSVDSPRFRATKPYRPRTSGSASMREKN